MPAEYTEFILQEEKTRDYPLDAVESLAGGVYPAEAFYHALVNLTAAERSGIPVTALELISWRYRLRRVAVSPGRMIGDRIEMGFELIQEDGLKTYRVLGRSSSVLALLTGMENFSRSRSGG